MTDHQRVPVLLPVAQDQTYDYRFEGVTPLVPGAFVKVPFGRQERIGIVWYKSVTQCGLDLKALHKKPFKPMETAKLKSVLHVFDLPPLRLEAMKFGEWVADYALSPLGMVARMMMSSPDVFKDQKPQMGVRYIHREISSLTPARTKVFDVLYTDPEKIWPKAQLAKEAGVGAGVVTGLVKAGCLSQEIITGGGFAHPLPDFTIPEFSSQQQRAVNLLRQQGEGAQFAVSLLDGVTGSGKTEVYFEAASKAFEQGRQALILLPEIILTNQFIDRFEARFGVKPAQWHSNISAGQKARIWKGVSEGHVKAVIGARSALFLPFQNLGCVIIDEEHDASYKQETQVLYHARDMAVVRATLDKCHVVLASATPSVETLVNVLDERYKSAPLRERFRGKEMPNVSAIDMRADGPARGEWLSPLLEREMHQVLRDEQQSLLFLNRRGYAPMTLCGSCGHKVDCPQCSSWLVEHRHRQDLMCHHCGFKVARPRRCPKCEMEDGLIAIGPGVERIAEEVASKFPSARVAILSSDVTTGLGAIRKVIDDIKERRVDIIIGTQMVAKGHNFPGLALVGVVDADLGLGQADPRAAERTFQLLYQVTGRAGRMETKGRGLVQTYMPDHPVMRAIIEGDRDTFLEREIDMRERALYPPYGRLAALIVGAKHKDTAQRFAQQIVRAAPAASGVTILGPSEAPLAMIRGVYRFRILVKAPKGFHIQNYLRAWMVRIPPINKGLKLTIDVDPYSFM